MDSMKDMLSKGRRQEPEEIRTIKAFVQNVCGEECSVLVRQRDIVIGVGSGAVAGNLRMQIHELQKEIPNKKLIIRIAN